MYYFVFACITVIDPNNSGSSLIAMFWTDLQMSSIKRIVPRLTSMAFKMKFSELVTEIKPVSNNDCKFCYFTVF